MRVQSRFTATTRHLGLPHRPASSPTTIGGRRA